jgi:hypothetical protein
LARRYGRSPAASSVEEIRDVLHHLITAQKVAFSTSPGIRSPRFPGLAHGRQFGDGLRHPLKRWMT